MEPEIRVCFRKHHGHRLVRSPLSRVSSVFEVMSAFYKVRRRRVLDGRSAPPLRISTPWAVVPASVPAARGGPPPGRPKEWAYPLRKASEDPRPEDR